MKKIIFLLIFVLLANYLAIGETKFGFTLSIGQIYYKMKNFSQEFVNIPIEPTDLFLGLTLSLNDQFEGNLVYNHSKGKYLLDDILKTYDKDGLALEIGKIIPINLFKKDQLSFFLDFVVGGYGCFYLLTKIEINQSSYKSDLEKSNPTIHYHYGFYWTIRLRNVLSNKTTIHIGFKSLVPIKSNEFISQNNERNILFRSYLFIGISF